MTTIASLRALLEKRDIRHVVMTNYTMAGIGGSQLVLRDIADILIAAGAKVIVVSPVIGEPMTSLMAAIGASTVSLVDPDVAEILPETADLLLGLHWPVVGMATIHHGMKFRHLVLLSLSPFEPVEALSILTAEADALLVNSEENLQHHRQLTGDAAFTDRIEVFPNSLPAKWFENAPPPPAELRRVLFVSNRRTARVVPLKDSLRSAGIEVREIGMGKEARLVDAALIDEHDAVVTIGHTVQKAMARQRPVFVFDRFGGPGWVTTGNFADLANFNFAGRGGPSLTAANAAAAFFEGYKAAYAEGPALFLKAQERFGLETHLGQMLGRLAPGVAERKPAGADAFFALRASQAFFSVRFGQSLDPAQLAPGVGTKRLRVAKRIPAWNDDGLHFRIDDLPPDAAVFGHEADFYISGLAMADDGGAVQLRAKRNDGLTFTTGAFFDSPGLAMQFPDLAAAKKARFRLELVAKSEGSNFTLTAETGARVYPLGSIEVKTARPQG